MTGRRIFLDVGANTGQSLKVAMDRRYAFDWIVCFEPAPQCWPYLEDMADKRVTIERFGLYSETVGMPLYEPGRKGASLFAKDYARSNHSEVCEFRRASDWFAENIRDDDLVWLKLNAEGAECDILDDLLESGEFVKIAHTLVGWHGRKIPSVANRERALRYRLVLFGAPRIMSDLPVSEWLDATCR